MPLRSRAKTVLDVGSSVLVLVAAVALSWTLYQDRSRSSSASASSVQDVQELTIETAGATKRTGTGLVAIVEFSDFQCPYCGKHARETFPQIRRTLVDPGRVTYISFAFPLNIHPLAKKASEAAECAARSRKYWQMHQRLFQVPMALEPQNLLSAAQEVGIEPAQFETCIADAATAPAVAADIQRAALLKVIATPTFFIGRLRADGTIDVSKRLNGALPYEAFEKAVTAVSKL